ncbi:hypothetical protein [Shigella phage ESh16]|nr:hypothetical protein [Shigella phage ESh16]
MGTLEVPFFISKIFSQNSLHVTRTVVLYNYR